MKCILIPLIFEKKAKVYESKVFFFPRQIIVNFSNEVRRKTVTSEE